MKDFSIIVAMDDARGIGIHGGLPWKLSQDMAYFKQVTTQADNDKTNAVIMGRKTWESIPEKFRPLPRRLNIVLTRDQDRCFAEGVLTARSLDESLEHIESDASVDRVFIIGGAQVYHEAVGHQHCRQLYITHITGTFECDAFFPDVLQGFEEVSCQGPFEENGIKFSFGVYSKNLS